MRRPRRRTIVRLGVCAVCAPAAAAVALAALSHLCPFPRERVRQMQSGGSTLMLDRDGGTVAWRVDSTDSWRIPVEPGQVSPWLAKATIAAEDKRFESHGGVDPVAMARAAYQNARNRRRTSGASTITMQSVRLMQPRPRTYRTKIIEAFRAVQLDRLMDKPAILQLYLNCAPYGGNVIGVEAASRRYFGKSAREVTLGEAALLAGVPQSPARFNPGKHLDSALERRAFVIERLRALGTVRESDLRAAEQRKVELAETTSPERAERFADFVISLYGRDGGVVRTTLDPEIHSATAACLEERAAYLNGIGIDGVAAVVVDVAASELVAMIGSADPSDPSTGFVNCATARRQPGSLLKPFIYAAAYDSGTLVPRSVVYDIPTAWKGYRPENMDRTFKGPMPAARALRESRNIPAVRLLDRLQVTRLVRDANRMNLGIDAGEQRCGLSLALGTAEVRLLDIVNAYATLARLGEYRPLEVTLGGRSGPSERVYSKGAAYLALRSLGAAPPGEEIRPAWKTGTSWRRRDAWAVALTPRYVVGVWCGRISGEGHSDLVGGRIALPMALEIVRRIWKDDITTWDRPDTVRTRRACALSGAPPSSWCPHTTEEEYLPGVSSSAPCPLHGIVREKGGSRVVTEWPGDVAAFLASRHAREATPAKTALRILSPIDEGEYVLASLDSSISRELEFVALGPPGTGAVYWFLDGELCGSGQPHEPVRWTMHPGAHELIACDERGISATVSFTVHDASSIR